MGLSEGKSLHSQESLSVGGWLQVDPGVTHRVMRWPSGSGARDCTLCLVLQRPEPAWATHTAKGSTLALCKPRPLWQLGPQAAVTPTSQARPRCGPGTGSMGPRKLV